MVSILRQVKIHDSNRRAHRVTDMQPRVTSESISDAQQKELADHVNAVSAAIRRLLDRYTADYARAKREADVSMARAFTDPAALPDEELPKATNVTEGEKEAAINAGMTVEELRAENAAVEQESDEFSNTLSNAEPNDPNQVLEEYMQNKPWDAEQVAAQIEGMPDDTKASFFQALIDLLKKAGVELPAAAPTPSVQTDSRATRTFDQIAAARRLAANGVSPEALRRIIEG